MVAIREIAPSRPAAAAQGRWKLGAATRKATLVVHLISAGAWIGIDVIVGVLVVAGWFSGDQAVRGVAYQALGLFALWPMLTSGLVCLASGVVLGMGTRYGLVRYWWVVIKLAMNLILCLLIVLALRPELDQLVEHGRVVAAGGGSGLDVSSLFFPPAVSLTCLTIATVLAVFKPWGRTRRSTAARGGGR